MVFILDKKLENDSEWVASLPLCQIRLHNNAAFPWLILIPQVNNIVELIDLSENDQNQLLKEINQASRVMKSLFQPKKLNIANLGNIVSQCHIHVIARFSTDLAWPHPVWNSGVESSYEIEEKKQRVELLANAFKEYHD